MVGPIITDLTTLTVYHYFGKDKVGGIDIVSDDLLVFVTDRNRILKLLVAYAGVQAVEYNH